MTDRDLSFKPVENPSPRKLTVEQIKHYNSQGYIRPINLFDDGEIARHREYFNNLLRKLNDLKDGRDAYALNCYQALCEGIWDLCTEPRILDYVEDIVGPNIIAWASHYFCKLPHDGKSVPWHQDASYWHLTPARTVTVWLAIDDANEGNAAMRFIPRTHRVGHLKWREAEGDTVLNQEIPDIDRFGSPVYDGLKAGQFSLLRLPQSKQVTAHGVLLLLYGYKKLKNEDNVGANALLAGLRQSGVQADRIDRPLQEFSNLVHKAGTKRGRPAISRPILTG